MSRSQSEKIVKHEDILGLRSFTDCERKRSFLDSEHESGEHVVGIRNLYIFQGRSAAVTTRQSERARFTALDTFLDLVLRLPHQGLFVHLLRVLLYEFRDASGERCIRKVELFVYTRVEEEGVNLSENVSIC